MICDDKLIVFIFCFAFVFPRQAALDVPVAAAPLTAWFARMSCHSSLTCTSSLAGRLCLPRPNTPQVVSTEPLVLNTSSPMSRLSPPPPRSRFRGCVRPRASEYPGRRGSSSDHGSRELPRPSEPAPCLGERLQAVSKVSAQPVVRVHQAGQEHRHELNGRPPAARSVRRKINGKHSGGGSSR